MRTSAVPVPGADSVRKLAVHLHLLAAWNRRVSLTAIRDPREAVRRHVCESLEAVPLLDPRPGDLLVDLGSGNGYPGIALLAACPALAGVLVESVARKAAFLRAALRECGLLDRAAVLERRVAGPEDLPASVTIVTLRAFTDPLRWIHMSLEHANVRQVLAWLGDDDAATAVREFGERARREPLRSTGAGAIVRVRR
ncbi:MAG: class I SAM-dependent methyltransferase [Acidobacteria bacterium]|nr:class I SAM-dependent methyltransferase [Acidobacteriota bacterium]